MAHHLFKLKKMKLIHYAMLEAFEAADWCAVLKALIARYSLGHIGKITVDEYLPPEETYREVWLRLPDHGKSYGWTSDRSFYTEGSGYELYPSASIWHPSILSRRTTSICL